MLSIISGCILLGGASMHTFGGFSCLAGGGVLSDAVSPQLSVLSLTFLGDALNLLSWLKCSKMANFT